MKKIKLKKQNKLNLFIIIAFIIVISGCIVFNYFSTKLSPAIYKYAEIETKKFSNLIINNAISETITDTISSDEIFEVTNDKNDEIKSIDFNTAKINKYLSDATKSIQNELENIEKGNIYSLKSADEIFKKYNKEDLKKGIIFYVSSGLFFKNPLLANLGPKIPVKISLTGDIISYVSSEIEDYGINNSVIKVYINLNVTENIILPFSDKQIEMKAKIPIAVKLVTGKIPEYYSNSKQTPQVVIPNKNLQSNS